MPVSAAKTKANKKWDAENLDRISLALPRGYKEKISECAVSDGISVSKWIKAAIDFYIKEKSE